MPAEFDSNFRQFDREFEGALERFEFYAGAVVQAINIEALEVAKSYTAATVPGLRKGEGPRDTHPGGWSDRTGLMIISFYQESRKIRADIFEGTLINTAEYSIYVEALGYWVLSGLFEGVIQEIADRHMKLFAEFISRNP